MLPFVFWSWCTLSITKGLDKKQRLIVALHRDLKSISSKNILLWSYCKLLEATLIIHSYRLRYYHSALAYQFVILLNSVLQIQ